jgi:hypothetical protein
MFTESIKPVKDLLFPFIRRIKMSKFSMSIFLQSYDDHHSSNAPSRSSLKWNRDLNSIFVNNPTNQADTVAPGETRVVFNGLRTLGQNGSTSYSIALKPLSSNTYVLSWAGAGAAPNFRTPRTTGADATTQVTTVVNGPIVTFTSTGGTNFNLTSGGCIVGDYVTIGNEFNTLNQGTFKLLALTATSFTIENPTAVGEGPITLGSSFATQVQIFSAAGAQVNDTIVISGGFSATTVGSYVVTAVYAESLEFFSASALPIESNIVTQVTIYSNAKTLVYIESDSALDVILNGVDIGQIEPFVISNVALPSLPPKVVPGVFMLKSTIYSLSVTNNGISPANIFFAAVE